MKKLIASLCLCLAVLPAQAAEFVHGLALHDTPKYGAGFTHFDYVNPDAPKGGTLRLSSLGAFDSLNPFILKGMAADQVGSLVYQTLMESSLDEAFAQYGSLAQSVSVADDNGSVTYRLQPKAVWSDGKPVTAEDVAFSFTLLTTKGNPGYRAYYGDVAKVEAIAPKEVRFVFKRKDNPELPLIVGQLPILPKHVWDKNEFDKTTLNKALMIGSGPYVIDRVDVGKSIRFARQKDWWGADLPVNRGMHNFDAVEVYSFRDATVSLEAFFAGAYDLRVENVAKTWATGYKTPQVKNGQVKLETIPNELPAGMQAYVFNTRKAVFRDKRVREAIALAFDFEWSNKRFAYGSYKRSTSYFSNSELASTGLPTGRELDILKPYKDKLPPEVFTQEFKIPQSDGSGTNRAAMKKAMQLLDEAGYKLNDKGQRVDPETGKPLTFEVIDVQQAFERWTLPFAANLKKIGITATFRVMDTAQYQNRMNDLDFDMTIGSFPQSLSPGNEQFAFWHSSSAAVKGTRNIAGVSDPVVDALVERIARAHSRDELVALSKALDRVLLWGQYVVPQWHMNAFRVAYWDTLGHPDRFPPYGLPVVETWWRDVK